MAQKHTSADLSSGNKVNFNKLGSASQGLVGFDLAVDGSGVIQDPSVRIMTGAITSAQATEQASAVTAAGGAASLLGKPIAETGKQVNK